MRPKIDIQYFFYFWPFLPFQHDSNLNMDRLKLVNTTRDIPLNLYNPVINSELHMRKVLLGYRHRAAISSSDGAPPLYYRWIDEDEWYPRHNIPPLQSYGSLDTVFDNKHNERYSLIAFYNPTIYHQEPKASTRMRLPLLPSKSTGPRHFNWQFLDFLSNDEAYQLNQWIDNLLDEHENHIATFEESDSEYEDIFTSESEDESPMVVDLTTETDSDCSSSDTACIPDINNLVDLSPYYYSFPWSPPRDPRLE